MNVAKCDISSQRRTTVKSAHGTGEWAVANVNIQRGCEHGCRYCYAGAMSVQYGRSTPVSWATPVLNAQAVARGYHRKQRGRVMFPTTHDITPGNIDACMVVLGKLLKVGNDVLIVSKPHVECVTRLCEELVEYKGQILFRFTLCSNDDGVLRFWEPGAPPFAERLASLKYAYDHGFHTSVSCEPMLDAGIDKVIEAVEPYVTDSIWLGRANRLRHVVAMNCPGNGAVRGRTDELIALWDDDAVNVLYQRYKDHSKIRFKDSIKKVVGLDRPTLKGLDV